LGGEPVSINPDFRIILKILKIHDDNEVNEMFKIKKMLEWFYLNQLSFAVQPSEALTTLVEFIAPPETEETDPIRELYKRVRAERFAGKQPNKKYCFEFDAEEIYISFIQDYKIDLVEIEYLHWYKFLMMFANLSKDTAFQRKLELRTMDLKDFKGKDKTKMMKAQQAVQLPIKLNIEEKQKMEEYLRKLMM